MTGKIVVVGQFATSIPAFVVVRYNSNGSLDNTFGTEGKVTTSLGQSDAALSVTLQEDGKIVVGGSSQAYEAGLWHPRRFAIARYHPSGSLDMSFNGTGKVLTAFSRGTDECYCVKVQGDGKIVACGHSDNAKNFAMARYRTDGSLDTTFDGSGRVSTAIQTGATARSLVLQNNGKIVLSGSSNDGASITIARYNPDGSLDTTFNGTGIVIVRTSTSGNWESGDNIAIQLDGKILVGGRTNVNSQDFVVLRYRGDPSDIGPRIDVEQPEFIYVANGSARDFGSVISGSSKNLSFRIKSMQRFQLQTFGPIQCLFRQTAVSSLETKRAFAGSSTILQRKA